MHALAGPNGAGKITLLGARCDRGYILRDGPAEAIGDAFGHETLSAAYF